MTSVNWERLDGSLVEELVAALLLSQGRHGNQITPSRGDGGIDVQIVDEQGVHVYQVKRFSKPLNTQAQKSVEDSWKVFAGGILATGRVASWTLVTPWNPTRERLAWLEALGASTSVTPVWIGRSQLDAWAAQRPDIVDYFCGNGQQRTLELMSVAIAGSQPIMDGEEGSVLLESIQDRAIALSKALEATDPFYRYDISVRSGPIPDGWASTDPAAVMSKLEQVSDRRFVVTDVFPAHPAAGFFRPISQTVILDRDATPAQRAEFEDFLRFGSAITTIPAEVTETQGPPGMVQPSRVILTAMQVSARGELPPFEAVLSDGDVELTRLELDDAYITRGVLGEGYAFHASDNSGTVSLLLKFSEDGMTALETTATSPTGKRPKDVIPALRFTRYFRTGTDFRIVGAGQPIDPTDGALKIDLADDVLGQGGRVGLEVAEALSELQRMCTENIKMPDLATLTRAELSELRIFRRVVAGETVEVSWEHAHFRTSTSILPAQISLTRPVEVTLSGETYATRARQQILIGTFVPHPDVDVASIKPGDDVRILPREGARAQISLVT